MRVRETAGDGEAEASPRAFCASRVPPAIEEVLLHVGREAGAVIFDRKIDRTTLRGRDGELDCAALRCETDSVLDNVTERAKHSLAIAAHGHRDGWLVHIKGNVFDLCALTSGIGSELDHVAGVVRAHAKRDASSIDLREIGEVSDESFHLRARAQHGFEDAQRARVGLVVRRRLEHEVCAHGHCCEWRAEIVADGQQQWIGAARENLRLAVCTRAGRGADAAADLCARPARAR